jgi:hypothetical protein
MNAAVFAHRNVNDDEPIARRFRRRYNATVFQSSLTAADRY